MDKANYYARQAVAYDKSGHLQAAKYFYLEAVREISALIENDSSPNSMKEISRKYFERAMKLGSDDERALSSDVKSNDQSKVERLQFLLSEGLSHDETGDYDAALALYTQGVQHCLECVKEANSAAAQQKFQSLAQIALDRAEAIKSVKSIPNLPDVPVDDLSNMSIDRDDDSEPAKPMIPEKSVKHPLSVDELKVLATTSKVNNLSFVPFLPSDLKERFAYPVPFTDKDGLLALSQKQHSRLKAWMRPDEFCQQPVLIAKVDPSTIKQNLIADCSFIASLAVSAQYESRFNAPLITNIIYPQNNRGQPIHNPCGKYMVKLYFNGISRKVIIDDRLPMGEKGQYLCSYSQNKSELWVSILEKAYMKVLGGYDFPGSNSNIDLNALTGWIPERVPLKSDTTECDKDALFEKLLQRFHQGHCLITIATGKLAESECERAGLVDSHAYAVLNLRRVPTSQNKSTRLLLLKNPWSHLRWKGRYSEQDRSSWSPELCKLLSYDPTDAKNFDDGVFWIDYESLCHFFDVFYINWNPSLFPYTHTLHS